ncbi:MAG: hypothetical protein Tsb005_00040 [Gammaproteobacteria bacterium]
MPVNTVLTSSERIRIFRVTLAKTFMVEWDYLINFMAGRAPAKGSFTSKIATVMKIAAGGVFDHLPGGGAIAQGIFDWVVDSAQEQAQTQKFEHIQALHEQAILNEDEFNLQPQKLYTLLREVARAASYMYEYAITCLANADEVTKLAYVAIERMLEYVARKRCALTKEALLIGLFEGRSGKYGERYTNNRLKLADNHPYAKLQHDRRFTCEGVFARSMLLELGTNNYYRIKKTEAIHRNNAKKLSIDELKQCAQKVLKRRDEIANKGLSGHIKAQLCTYSGLTLAGVVVSAGKTQWDKFADTLRKFGYTNTIDADDAGKVLNRFKEFKHQLQHKPASEELAKYGVVVVPAAIIARYAPKIPPHVLSITEQNKLLLNQYRATVHWASTQEMREYYKNLKTVPSLLHFMRTKHHQQLMTIVYSGDMQALGKDWQGANFSDADLSDANFSGCNLQETVWDRACILRCRLDGAQLQKASLRHVEAQHVQATKANFQDADMSHALFNDANLQGANLINIIDRGTQWQGVNLQAALHTETWLKNLAKRQQQAIDNFDQQLQVLRGNYVEFDQRLQDLELKVQTPFNIKQTDTDSNEWKQRLQLLESQLAKLPDPEKWQALLQTGCEWREQQALLMRVSEVDVLELTQQCTELKQTNDATQVAIQQVKQLLTDLQYQQQATDKYFTTWLEQLAEKLNQYEHTQLTQYQVLFEQYSQELTLTIKTTTADYMQLYQQLHQSQSDFQQQLDKMNTRVDAVEAKLDTLHHELNIIKQNVLQRIIEPYEVIPNYLLHLEAQPVQTTTTVACYRGTYSGLPVWVECFQGATHNELEQFLREIRILRRLRHYNIVMFYGGMVKTDNHPVEANSIYSVVEYVAGGDVYTQLSTLDSAQALSITIDLAHAIQFLHHKKILHRNLNLKNILIDATGRAKLTGFGFAKLATASLGTADFTHNTELPRWQAPEFFKYLSEYVSASEIYSIGRILWSLLTRQIPYADIMDANKLATSIEQAKPLAATITLAPAAQQLIADCCQYDAKLRPTIETVLKRLTQMNANTLSSEDYYHQAINHEKNHKPDKAYDCYHKATEIEPQFAKAYTNLGFFKLTGTGCTANLQEAYRYILRGANAGHVRAMYNLGVMFQKGEGVERDLAAAAMWYKKAGDQGDSKAQAKYCALQAELQASLRDNLNSCI